MSDHFDDQPGPNIQEVVAQYRDAMAKRARMLLPLLGLVLIAGAVWAGTYSVEPGEIGVVRRFGKMVDKTEPGLHFRIPILEKVDVVNVSQVQRAEIGFRSTKAGPKRVDTEALMLTGDENIVEAFMIVQYKIADPVKYLFRLRDPKETLHVAAEVALRGVVGQTSVAAGLEDLEEAPTTKSDADADAEAAVPSVVGSAAPDTRAAPDASAAPVATAAPTALPSAAPSAAANAPPPGKAKNDRPHAGLEGTDILTTGRERAQVVAKIKLQELMDLYESGLIIVELKLQAVDAPDEVKDAFHDVVRAREEREKKINTALGYRQDRIPRARGEALKILRSAEAYRRERIELAKGEAARFKAILLEYSKARAVTRERLHLETMERILMKVNKKVFIDADVAKGMVPILPLGDGLLGGAPKGDK